MWISLVPATSLAASFKTRTRGASVVASRTAIRDRINATQDVEQRIERGLDGAIERALNGAYANGECGGNEWKTPSRCVSALIAHC